MPVRARLTLLLVAGLLVVAVVLALVVVDVRSRPAATLPGSTSAPSPAVSTTPALDDVYYGSRTAYPAPTTPDTAAPAGYDPVFVQHLGRHGARTSTPGDHGERAGELWRRASAEQALTPLGAGLGPVLDALDAATDRLGLGRLTAVGRSDQEGIGRRAGTRLADLWASAGDGDEVDVVTSGRTRAEQSAAGFVAGLSEVEPGLDVEKARTDKRLLYFDSTDPGYRAFLAGKDWRPPYAEAVRPVDLAAASREVLERLYTPAFVASVDDPQEEAESLFERYRNAPSLADDLETPVDMRPFFPASAAAAFTFVEDARYFYARGPGVVGDGRSHEPAQVLVDDFLDNANQRLDGGHTLAVLQFAHAEEVAPLAALLELPGSRTLGSAQQVYSWTASDFRTASVIPLSATIEWTVWRDAAGAVLVSVTENEAPTTLGRGCRPADAEPGYYALDELRRCLAAT